MVEIRVDAILFDLTTNAPVVVLKDLEGKRILPIWIGPFEASAIEMELEDIKAPRPMTHDLLKNVLDNVGAKVVKIVVNDLQDNTFIATIHISLNGKTIEVDSRPSDAIAIALRMKARIFAVDWILKEACSLEEEGGSGSGNPEDDKTKFRKFLENIKPDDFKYKH